jgi:hypothetical protein
VYTLVDKDHQASPLRRGGKSLASVVLSADLDAISSRRIQDAIQVYRDCTDDQRRLRNHALFRRLYLAENRITSHEPWPATPLT